MQRKIMTLSISLALAACDDPSGIDRRLEECGQAADENEAASCLDDGLEVEAQAQESEHELDLAGVAQSALAAQGYNLSTKDYVLGGAGWASASGELTFGGERQLSIRGSATDHCVADGWGAYVAVEMRYMDGTFYRPDTHIQDTNGCGNGPETFGSQAVTNYTGKRIKYAMVMLCEADGDGQQGGEAHCIYGAKRYNPYTN